MLIRSGTPYETSIGRTDPHRRKYSCAMAEYLDLSGHFDNSTGEADAPMGYVSLHGRRLLMNDSRGFVDVDTYPTSDDARVVFDAISDWYALWVDEEQYHATDEDYATFVAKFNDAERYCAYVVNCATNGLAPHDLHMWVMTGRPVGAL